MAQIPHVTWQLSTFVPVRRVLPVVVTINIEVLISVGDIPNMLCQEEVLIIGTLSS